jgi:uncharacterized protein YjiS (DUF1127 family)
MDKRYVIENDLTETELVDMRLMSGAEWSIVHQRIVGEARNARAAAIQNALLRALAAGGRSLRLIVRSALGCKPATVFCAIGVASAARRRRLIEAKAASELKRLSDYALSDVGIARSEIRRRVRVPAETSHSHP